jgi:hypothetical protein
MSNTKSGNGNGNGNGHGHGRRGRCSTHGHHGRPVCPYCLEKDEVIPIFYGFPSDKAFLRAERGEVYLGGAIAGPTAYYCKRDDREF